MNYIKLNLGCGYDIKQNYINLDYIKNKGVDNVWNLNKFPYPFKDNTFDEVFCSHVIEHLDDPIKVMKEIHRISKPNAKVIIKVPHFTAFNALTELTHKHSFAWQSFDPYERKDSAIENYGNVHFKIISKKINFSRGDKLKLLNKIMNFFINKILLCRYNIYERFFCYILPSEEIIYVLRVTSDSKK